MANTKDDPSVEVDFDAKLPGEIETDATGKNILIKDPEADLETTELQILEYAPPEPDKEEPEEESFDPYNSGSYDLNEAKEKHAELAKAREWKTKSRK